MNSVGLDAANAVLISRFGVYAARSATFWIRRFAMSVDSVDGRVR
jgi:hypothetical protein